MIARVTFLYPITVSRLRSVCFQIPRPPSSCGRTAPPLTPSSQTHSICPVHLFYPLPYPSVYSPSFILSLSFSLLIYFSNKRQIKKILMQRLYHIKNTQRLLMLFDNRRCGFVSCPRIDGRITSNQHHLKISGRTKEMTLSTSSRKKNLFFSPT